MGKNVCEAARLRILDQNNFRKLRKQQRFQRTKKKKNWMQKKWSRHICMLNSLKPLLELNRRRRDTVLDDT
jgi:hypothetical protein